MTVREFTCPNCNSPQRETDTACLACGQGYHEGPTGTIHCMVHDKLYAVGSSCPDCEPENFPEPVLPECSESSQDRIRQAQAGQRGPQQKLIALLGLQVVDLLLRKNHDYGGSVFQSPEMLPDMKPTDALIVRMSDKIQRMKYLMTREAEVSESMEDTMKDQAGYSILWLCCNWIEQGKWDEPEA